MKKIITIMIVFVVLLTTPSLTYAEPPPPGHGNPDDNKPIIQISGTVQGNGYYIQITVRQSSQGDPGPLPGAASSPSPSEQQSSNTQQTNSTNDTTSQTVAWTDENGYHTMTSNGQMITVQSAHSDLHGTLPNYNWPIFQGQHPNATPYEVTVNGQFTQIIWVPNGTTITFGTPPAGAPAQPAAVPASNGSLDPYQVALDAYAHVPLPQLQIKMNPALGLVALPGWFWIDGYDGKPFGTTRTVIVPPAVGPEVPASEVPLTDTRRLSSAFTVDVQVWATGYAWSFGDGGNLTTQSLGQRFPQESTIQHTYEHSSLAFPDGFPVRVTTTFEAEYRVNGGSPQPLPSIHQTYAATYPVQEIQPVLVGH